VVGLLAGLAGPLAAAPAFLWREAASADEANFKIVTDPMPTSIVSSGKWLKEVIDGKDNIAKKLGDGRDLKYKINVATAGAWHVWIRAGFEFIRAPMAFRFDDGPFKTIAPTDLSRNLIEVYTWTEIGWLDGGETNLTAGPHVFEIKADKANGDRFLLALDSICLVNGDWTPDGPLKPGETPDGELDKAAAAQVYPVAPATAGRARASLDGVWQVARYDDPDMDAGAFEPVKSYPANLVWRGLKVPGELFKEPLYNFAHRVVYRTRFEVPAGAPARSYVLDFAGTNWMASVLVNGHYAGWSRRNTRVPWQLDVTPFVKPGLNELAIIVKGPWYGLSAGRGESLNKSRNLPPDFWKWHRQTGTFEPSTKGDTDGMPMGLTDPVALITAGAPVYVSDVFVKPQVVGGQVLRAEVTVTNPSAAEVTAQVTGQAVFEGSGQSELSLPAATVTVPAGGTALAKLEAPFPAAKLWWPGDNPAAMYKLAAAVSVGGKAVDSFDQRFGFRDVTIDGKFIRINGVRRNFWNLGGGFSGATDAARLAHFYRGHNRFERFSHDIGGDTGRYRRSEQLDWLDSVGIPGRLSTMIDGMAITHELNNPLTWEAFAEHIEQVVRAYRNHPSVIVYSLENEIMFITAALAYRGDIKRIEKDAKRCLFDVSHQWDPTRPAMLDGGGALTDNSAEICCTHYAEDGFHPDNAFPLTGYKSQGLWSWDEKRPYCAGEIDYFQGNNAEHAWIGGESAALSRADALKAYSKYLRYTFERFRWNDVAITCPWTGQDGSEDCQIAMMDLAAFTREYNHAFFGGEPFKRTVKVFNDTWSKAPVQFAWALEVGGQRVASETQTLTIEPGFNQTLDIACTAPKVAGRTAGKLYLTVSQPGGKAETFRDAKPIVVDSRISKMQFEHPRPIAVLDADGTFAERLAKLGLGATTIKTADAAPAGGVVLVAPGQLTKAATPLLLAYAKAGGRVVCLEQSTPWQGNDLGVPLALAKGEDKRSLVDANFTFGQGAEDSLLAGLGPDDLSCWAGDEPTAAKVWARPAGGARSWVACGSELKFSALVQVNAGAGVLLATQLRVGAKFDLEPCAQRLLLNLVSVAQTYQPPSATVTLCCDRAELGDFIKSLGCKLREVPSVAQALDAAASPIAVIDATRTHLEELLAQSARVQAYWAAGGRIVLCGLQPDGLPAFNQLLGTQHVMREFRVERVKLRRSPLTAGLDNPDVTMYGDQVIAPWAGLKIMSRNVFTTCVDASDEIGPFCFGPVNPNWQFTAGGGPYNLVNGLFNSDMWQYIDQMPYQQIPPEFNLHTFKLPGPTKLAGVTIWNNANYDTAKGCEVRLDGQTVAKVELPDGFGAVDVPLGGAAAKEVGLFCTSVRVRQANKLIGLDEVSLRRVPPDWAAGGRVVPLVDVGGLVAYPRGKGGVVLNQLKLSGDNKENMSKKQRLMSVLLQNMGAAFEGQ
jgi:beta-galactosidase